MKASFPSGGDADDFLNVDDNLFAYPQKITVVQGFLDLIEFLSAPKHSFFRVDECLEVNAFGVVNAADRKQQGLAVLVDSYAVWALEQADRARDVIGHASDADDHVVVFAGGRVLNNDAHEDLS